MTCIVNVSFSCKADTQHVRVSVAKHFAFNGQHREQDLDERAEPRRRYSANSDALNNCQVQTVPNKGILSI